MLLMTLSTPSTRFPAFSASDLVTACSLILDNNVDTGRSLPEIPGQRSRVFQRSTNLAPLPFVHRRRWLDLYVVNDLVHAFDALPRIFGIGLGYRVLAGDTASQGHCATLHGVPEIVE